VLRQSLGKSDGWSVAQLHNKLTSLKQNWQRWNTIFREETDEIVWNKKKTNIEESVFIIFFLFVLSLINVSF